MLNAIMRCFIGVGIKV